MGLAMRTIIRRFLLDERGATVVEYGLIVAVLSLTIVAGFGNFTEAFTEMFTGASTLLEESTP